MYTTLRAYYNLHLGNIYSGGEIGILYRTAMSYVCGIGMNETYFRKDTDLNEKECESMRQIADRLEKNEPIDYIIGEKEFCGLTFKVNRNVLIPRPETAWIVERIKALFSNKKVEKAIDICTGSGCIAISLAKNGFFSSFDAIDISRAALTIAKENNFLNGTKINFFEADILDTGKYHHFGSYNLIVSNPPYVRDSEKTSMEANVLDYEPHLALFVSDEDPLIFYRHIALFATGHLEPEGMVCVEINQYLGQETAELFRSYGFNVTIEKDLFSNERLLIARRTI